MLTKQKFSRKDLLKILKRYEIGKMSKIKPLLTSGNIAFVIETSKNEYILRLCPKGARYRSRSEIAAEIELIKHLLKNKFPVARPIPDKFGNFVISWKRHNGYLREFIRGKEKTNPSLKEIKKFGNLLGQFHQLVDNYRTRNKRKHIFDPRETKKYFEKNKKLICNDGQKGELFSKIFSDEINKIKLPRNLPSGMIHEDLGKRHVLWRGSKIAGIIDFDRSYFGYLILDLGEACRGWCFVNNWKKWSNKNFNALIRGYEKERKLSSLEKKYLINTIRFGILERGLAFALRYILVTKDPEDEKYAWHSIFDNGLIGMIDKNSKAIEKILNKKIAVSLTERLIRETANGYRRRIFFPRKVQ